MVVAAPVNPELPSDLTEVGVVELEDDAVIEDVVASAVDIDGDPRAVEIRGCRFVGAAFTGELFEELMLTDVIFDDCELSGATMLTSSLMRAHNVTFDRCKLDNTNFRMSKWQRARSPIVKCNTPTSWAPHSRTPQ